MNTTHPYHRYFLPRRWLLGAFACFIVLCLILGGYWFVKSREAEKRLDHYEHLETIARLKTNHLLAWRQERLSDAQLDSSGYIQTHMLDWLKTGDPAVMENIASRMRFLQTLQGYHNMILAGTDGRILVSLLDKNSSLEPEVETLMAAALSTPHPVLGDFYHCHTCELIHLNVAISVVDKNRQAVAVLILVDDPVKKIFPLMQDWPVPHANAESFLIRKEGDRVLFLSPLRHQAALPFSFAGLELSSVNCPAVRAVLGETGMVTGKDYRGVPVLADIRPVPNTPWFMVTKMDLAPLLTEVQLLGWSVLFVVVMLVIMAATLVRLAYVSKQKDLSEALVEAKNAQIKTQEEIRATLYGIGAGVIATDADGLVTRLNPEAEKMCGWTEQEALDQPLASVYCVINEETSESVKLPIEQVLAEGVIVEVSNHVLLVARDGQCRPVTDSWSPIYNETGDINGVVLVFRDQTRKKAMEMAQIESGKRYSNLVENVNDFIWETDPEHRFTFVNSRVTAMLGYCPEEIIGRPWDTFLCAEEATADDSALSRAYFQPYSMSCQTWISKDGGKVIFESNASATFDQQGQFLGYQGISRDITDRRLAEAEQE